MATENTLLIRQLGVRDYLPVWQAMSRFTDERNARTGDELWFVQHPAVFTQGQAGSAEHVLKPGDIPIIQVDRGGQVTYHGPGQVIAYPLINLRRHQLSVRALVTVIEKTLIDTLGKFDISAQSRAGAPGVYVAEAKIASLGLRIRKGCSFHGLSLNVDMDLSPFECINPCGYRDLKVTQIRDLITGEINFRQIEGYIVEHFVDRVGYSGYKYASQPHAC